MIRGSKTLCGGHGERVSHGGGSHTLSHGGTYVGGSGGSSHQGGTYSARLAAIGTARTSNRHRAPAETLWAHSQ